MLDSRLAVCKRGSYNVNRAMEQDVKPAPNPDKKALARVGESVRKRLAADPTVYRFETDKAEIFALGDFMSAQECARVMELIDRVARPSTVYDQGEEFEGYRTSWSGDVDGSDSVIRMVERRLSDLLGIDLAWGEAVQGQRYHPGQEFQAHCDWFHTPADYWQTEVARGGQRSWTAMVYLNAVEEGGETLFPNLGLNFMPRPGWLLLWNNALPDGAPNEDTIHAALPVVRGVKYVITKWFRTRPWS